MRYDRESGFGLVEVLIAVFLLGIIAVALLPALWQGVILSSQQSSVATATRYLNSLVEGIRADPSCTAILALDDVPVTTATDGYGAVLAASFAGGVPSCAAQSAVSFTLRISDESGSVLADAPVIVYVP